MPGGVLESVLLKDGTPDIQRRMQMGKGSAPRKGADQKAYEDNWEKIFGKNKVSSDAMEVIATAQKSEKDDKGKKKD